MGYKQYSFESRVARSASEGYQTKSVDQIFTQNTLKQIHESMAPKGLGRRECCDSSNHPNTVPIILSLDITGSMGRIPHNLIQTGLPKLMSNLIQKGVPDASLCFIAVGDHEYDRAPLQVGQFESGDQELDTWLTRTWLEGNGGSNNGESYLLAWLFGALHTKIDSFDKRGKKGFLITIGDEPCLNYLPANVITEITGSPSQKGYSDIELLKEAQRMYEVYHIHVMHSWGAENSLPYWQNLLGQNCLKVSDYTQIPDTVAQLVVSQSQTYQSTPTQTETPATPGNSLQHEEIIL
jgi:hypothetical protein